MVNSHDRQPIKFYSHSLPKTSSFDSYIGGEISSPVYRHQLLPTRMPWSCSVFDARMKFESLAFVRAVCSGQQCHGPRLRTSPMLLDRGQVTNRLSRSLSPPTPQSRYPARFLITAFLSAHLFYRDKESLSVLPLRYSIQQRGGAFRLSCDSWLPSWLSCDGLPNLFVSPSSPRTCARREIFRSRRALP